MMKLFQYIKHWFTCDTEKDKAWRKAWSDALNGPIEAIYEILGYPHSIYATCSKCEHLIGRPLNKETYLELFKIHDIKPR